MGFCRRRSFLLITLLIFLSSLSGPAQTKAAKKVASGKSDPLLEHYDAARTLELGGDQARAAAEYKLFLAEALRRMANARADAYDFSTAAQYFDQAVALAPENSALHLDYAVLRMRQNKLDEAKAQLEQTLKTTPENAKAHALLGRVLVNQEDYNGAKPHLEAAVVAAPSFEAGYDLGITYIKLNDLTRAELLFKEMTSGLGDSAQLHMLFGRAYRQGEYLDRTVEEFKKAIAKDPKTPQVHYFLGMAYLGRDNESGFPEAIPEFRAELKNNPSDSRSHYMLGYIAFRQHDSKTAESELLRASQLDPQNPDPLAYLGQLYSDNHRGAEAETVLRKSIALTTDVSRNEFQVGRSHYVLGRILLQTGRREEGEKELKASEEVRRQVKAGQEREEKSRENSASFRPEDDLSAASASTPVSRERLKKAEDYENELKPALADAFNNLGVAAAAHKDFKLALEYFREAQVWNPSLATLDRNIGMAAFYSAEYARAVAPLRRHLQGHPDDVRVRAALGLSLSSVENYRAALEVLEPMEAQVDADPGLSYAFALSMVKAGDYNKGLERLKAVAAANPNSADVHVLLGSVYADQKIYATALDEYRKALAVDPAQPRTHFLTGLALIYQGNPRDAVPEFEAALKLNAADVESRYHLAFALLQMQKKDEALPLLLEVIRQDPKFADAFYQLGKIQLEQGETKAAILNLETSAKLNPGSDYMHYQLSLAYQRDARSEDAKREMKLYQAIKVRRRGQGGSQSD
jgi:tetratricopeptide (TPR) repeat protein